MLNFLDAQSPQGQITSSGIYTGNVGIGVADFLLGDVSTAAFTTDLAPYVVLPDLFAPSRRSVLQRSSISSALFQWASTHPYLYGSRLALAMV